MKILIVGSGGREHAIAWKVRQSKLVSQVYVAPGNAGTAQEVGITNINISSEDIQSLLEFAQREAINLTIIGPEAPLVAGIVDQFNEAGLLCFGPSSKAAQLEGSKTFSKQFMVRNNIPTAAFKTFTIEAEAIQYIKNIECPIVVKADGLAAGKGVIIAQSETEAIAAVSDMLSGNTFGEAGNRVVIEEFITGEEASFIVIADGVQAIPMATSQDHKARDDGDVGPNTGGMGAYSPAPIVTPELHEKIMNEVIYPTLRGMQAEGNRYTGFLYAGLMINNKSQIKVLEYNCRFGDPETQPIMMRLKSDLVELCLAALNNNLENSIVNWDDRPALGVVLAAKGYPNEYKKNIKLENFLAHQTASQKIFHAGTVINEKNVLSNGGRVLCACALGENLQEAKNKAYEICHKINNPDLFYRSDIGFKAIKKL